MRRTTAGTGAGRFPAIELQHLLAATKIATCSWTAGLKIVRFTPLLGEAYFRELYAWRTLQAGFGPVSPGPIWGFGDARRVLDTLEPTETRGDR